MRNEIVVRKMTAYSQKLLEYCDGYTYEAFKADSKTVEACVFNLSQLGELCHIVDKSFSSSHLIPKYPGRKSMVFATASFTIMKASISASSGRSSPEIFHRFWKLSKSSYEFKAVRHRAAPFLWVSPTFSLISSPSLPSPGWVSGRGF